MAFPKAIITKPFLITNAEYQEVGQNITLVGYDEFSQKKQESKGHASPRLLNWVEPYEVGGERKTLFYTEVNSNIQPGEKVFIINGAYDSNLLISKDKYKKGRDGYNVIKVDGCKIALDIDYTGALPYKDSPLDDFIKVYYIDSEDSFIAANRQMTTRGQKLDYKFNYAQNNIAFIDKDYGPIEEWGRNGGAYGTPGFFVREENTYLTVGGRTTSIREQWNNISDSLVYLGSFSVALSPTYPNNGRMLIMNGSFTYAGIDFKEGVAYKWNEKKNVWEADVEYSAPIISKSNFRSGTFKGKFNAGTYGSFDKKLKWTGKGIWNGGTLLNSRWEEGTMNSLISISPSLKSEKDQYGIPLQKPNTSNNAGFGYNYVIGCEVEKSVIQNGNFIDTKFVGHEGTFSVVEEHILGITQSFDNTIIKAFFDSCEFTNLHMKGGELKNVRAFNSRLTNIKSVNSYFKQSVLKDSTYIGEGVMKILGYDEWNMSEYRSRTSGTYSHISVPNSKIYKFYISKESFDRMRSSDTFYIKGLKIKDMPKDNLLSFFDGKFKLSSWNCYFDDLTSGNPYRNIPASFYKRGFECSAFLSTPEENSYIINTVKNEYNYFGRTYSRIKSAISATNSNKGYSIDIVASRHDVFNKINTLDTTTDRFGVIPRNFNYATDVSTGTASLPALLGSNIDFSEAYIVDADFHSGIVETSDWNSGYHINFNNDVALGGPTSTGQYAMSIDSENDYLIVKTPMNPAFPEGRGLISEGDIIFLNAIDYDNSGMVSQFTIIATGSSYSTTNAQNPATLVNTKVESLTMSSSGMGYESTLGAQTLAVSGSGKGLTIDYVAYPIGSVISITYSAPMLNGGSYSVNITSNQDNNNPPATQSFSEIVLTDTNGTITGVTGATYTAVSRPGITYTIGTGSAIANAIYHSGPTSSIESGLMVRYYTLASGAISSLTIYDPGMSYLPGQVFKVEGGNATFSITSVSYGEIATYSISSPGEDYVPGDIVELVNPYDPNSRYILSTASFIVSSITASSFDKKGFSLDITAGPDGGIVGATISNPGLFYSEGEVFTISGGKLNATVRIDSVTGSSVRLTENYKVVQNSNGRITLKGIGTQSIIAGLTGGGIFYTRGAMNRWNYLSKTKIDRSKIKSGIFRRAYVTRSLIRDAKYSSSDKDFNDMSMIKDLMFTDSIFSGGGNILSSATYLYSSFCQGSDLWNDGIIYKSIVNGMTFSRGTVKSSSWIDGTFTGGTFYESRSFNAYPSIAEKNFLSNSLLLYYMKGDIYVSSIYNPENWIYNGRYAWYSGTFSGGEFYKSDWDGGSFNGGLFYNSKFYRGTINGGIFGTNNVDAKETRVYDATVNYATVNNAYVYAEDTSYEGLSSSTINWNDGVFNGGVFGSNNDRIMGSTISTVSYNANIGALPIKDYMITTASVAVTDNTPISGEFEIEATITLKHTYIGDLVINLMSPNGKIINLKRKYSGGSSDNMISSVFTSDITAPSMDIWLAPYTGTFKFARLIGQGVYYNLAGKSISGPYKVPKEELPSIKSLISYLPPSPVDGDRYLVVATANDPTWTGQNAAPNIDQDGIIAGGTGYVANALFPSTFRNSIVQYRGATQRWIFVKDDSGRIIDDPKDGDNVLMSSGQRLVFYRNTWTRSYHSNVADISEMLNSDKTVAGNWQLLVMDDAGIDIGFVDEFSLSFSYKNSYLIKSYSNRAVWYDGIFNGGQFVNLGIWKDGVFNGGKFISTYGWTSSGDFFKPGKEDEYTWQSGVFNGGEFGTEAKGANSTWFTGEFNGGVFKGRLWNDGIFTYGEFKGGSTLPAVGGTITSEEADSFVRDFATGKYYGLWRKGTVSAKKDDFVLDKKIFTQLQRATKPAEKGKKAVFTNFLWEGGIFNHQSGEIRNSVWLDGLFKNGRMENSAFNPYVKRFGDMREFSKDDSSIWENGTFKNGEFHYSKWMQGKFISGTAVGMIWKNGISNYMNAYNIFWENGIWRNGNWNGSTFDYSGKVSDGFAKEILNRGIEWSGTSSCHIWNIFESDTDRTRLVVKSLPADSFATDNVDDAGVQAPVFINATIDASPNVLTKVSATEISFQFKVNIGNAALTKAGIAYTEYSNAGTGTAPQISASTDSNGNVTISPATSDTQIAQYSGSFAAINSAGEGMITVSVTNLQSSKYYSFMAYAANKENTSSNVISDIRTIIKATISGAPTLGSIAAIYPTSSTTNPKISITSAVNDTNTSGSAKTGGIIYSTTNYTNNLTAFEENASADIKSGEAGTGLGTGPGGHTMTTNIKYYSSVNSANLLGNTTYYFRTWVQNAGGRDYSAIGTFKTGAIAPSVTTTDPSTGTETSQLSITVTSGGEASLRYGFIIWDQDKAIDGTITGTDLSNAKNQANLDNTIDSNGNISSINENNIKYIANQTAMTSATQTFTLNVAYTEPGKTYRFVAFAISMNPINANDNLYSLFPLTSASPNYFTFKAAATVPTVSSTDISTTNADITSTSALLNGNVTADGGAAITKRGFVYKNASGSYPDPSSSPSTSMSANSGIYIDAVNSTGGFTSAATGLVIGEEYLFKAFAINSKGVAYSQERQFVTKAEASIATRSNTISTSGTPKLASLLGTLTTTNTGGSTITTPAALEVSGGTTFGTLIPNPTTALGSHRKFYIRASISNAGGKFNSSPEEAWTLADIDALPAISVTEKEFTAQVKRNSVAVPPITDPAVGIKLYDSTNNLISDIPMNSSSGTPPVHSRTIETSGSITISPGTKYYYRGYADNSVAGLAWNANSDGTGGTQRVLTPSPGIEVWTLAEAKQQVASPSPTLTYTLAGTPAVATLTMKMLEIINAGGSTITEYGFTWAFGSTAPTAVSSTNKKAITGTITTSVAAADISHTFASTPSAGAYIQVRPYVVNQAGTFLGTNQQIQAT